MMEEDTTRGMWSEEGYPLSVCVQGDDYYFQLLEDDLRKVFGRYGEVRLIEVTSPDRDVAHVYYEQLTDAQNAVQDLNDKILNGVHGALQVVWGLHHTPRAFPNTDRPLKSSRDHPYARGSQAVERTQGRHDGVSEVDPCSGRSLEDTEAAISRLLSEIRDVASPLKGNKAHPLGSAGSPSGAASGPQRSDAWRTHSPTRRYGERRAGWSSSAEEHFYDDAGKGGTAITSPVAAPPPALVPRGSATGAPASGGPVRKFTCRFDIGIENDKEFQVARRIIGNKGVNMKRIVGLSNAKLRLRGQGSGYLEGAVRQESPDPLHLCISCINRDGYLAAVEETKTLLRRVYTEWRNFQINKGRGDPGMMEIQMKEHFLTAAGERDLDMDYTQPMSTPMNHHLLPTSRPIPSPRFPPSYYPANNHAASNRGGPYNYPR